MSNDSVPVNSLYLDDVARAKVDAVIKDAGQYWLAILCCFVCTGVGFVVIGPWYYLRLRQWHALADKHVVLMTIDPTPGSVADRFQRAKGQIKIGLGFGAGLFILTAVWLLIDSWLRR